MMDSKSAPLRAFGKAGGGASGDTSIINSTPQIIAQFRQAMAASGIVTPDEIVPDGRLHRAHIEGHKRGSKNLAYCLHLDGVAAGFFQDWTAGNSVNWRADGGPFRMDRALYEAMQKAKRQRLAEAEAKHARAATMAADIWGSAVPCVYHPYLTRKNVPAHGLRVASWSKWVKEDSKWKSIVIFDCLLVPLRDAYGKLWNLQGIFPGECPEFGRDKDFLSGGRKSGLFHTIGAYAGTVIVAEGYATAASVHALSGGKFTVCAFDAGNLLPVARTMRGMYPDAQMVIAADDDRFTEGNPGLCKALTAARAVDGVILKPEFLGDAPGTDWNDWALLHAVDEVGL